MSDTKRVILCPACGNLMSKIYIPNEEIDLDFCDTGCGGIFFNSGELEKLDKNPQGMESIMEISHSKFFNPIDKNITRRCPVCNLPMRKVAISDFEIDFCDECGGKFLDNGEFKKLHDIEDIKLLLS